MSRLDSAIRRLMAQRDCLNFAAKIITQFPGPICEFGLGNGRTYDHLRMLFPDRAIFVFDRRIAAHADCVPPPSRMILGPFAETLVTARARIGIPAALAHADVGCGDAATDRETAALLSRALPALMAPNAVVVADQALSMTGWHALGLPEGVPPGRYFIYRRIDGTDD